MNEDEIAIYIQLWTSVNSYVSVKDKESACEHFLAIINEHVTDLEGSMKSEKILAILSLRLIITKNN